VVSQDVFKAGSAFSGGVARHGETCGALVGAIMAIGALMGRERLPDQEQSQKAMEPAVQIYEAFKGKIGHTLCSEIHKIRHGKTYRLYIPEERKAFHDAGGHGPEGCPVVCGVAARVAAEVILGIKEGS
jgi:C_GCAxxG_C_C family probable redox protein